MVVLLVYFRKIKYGDSPSSWLFNVRSQSNSPQHQFAGENQRSGQKLPSRSYYVTKPMDKVAKLFNLFAKYVQNRVKLKQPRRQRQMEVSVPGLIRVVSCCLRTTRPHGYQDTSYFKIWIHLFYFRDRHSVTLCFQNPDIQNERRRPNVNRKLVHYEVNYPNNKIYLCIQQIKSWTI